MIVAARLRMRPRRYMESTTYADHRLYVSAFGKEALAPVAPILMGLGKSKKRKGGTSTAAQDDTLPDDYWTRGHPGRPYTTIHGKSFANQASFEFWRSMFVTKGIFSAPPPAACGVS